MYIATEAPAVTDLHPARAETFSILHWKRGVCHERSGTWKIDKLHRAALFQAKNDSALNRAR